MTTATRKHDAKVHVPANDEIKAVLAEYEKYDRGHRTRKSAASFRLVVDMRIRLLQEHYKITDDPVIRARIKRTIKHNRRLVFDPDRI